MISVAQSISVHEQTHLNRLCYFHLFGVRTFMTFQKDQDPSFGLSQLRI